ncbi:MAG: hypothetical protein IJK86_00970 [Lachnospiraceae bacterium]|nr:hypothetical protein [Lachnospiraceae bacterium]
MNRRRFRSLFPYLLTSVLLIALAAGFLLSRRPVTGADVSDPAGRVYVSEAGERSAAEAQSQIRAARKSASSAGPTAEPSGTAAPPPTEPVPTETLPTAPPETVPPETGPAETGPAGSDSEPRTDAPPESPAETTADPEPPTEPESSAAPAPTTSPGPSPETILASLQEQIRTLNIDLFTPDELASIRRRFDGAVFTGDSMAQGLVSFELFDENHVKFQRGASVGEFDPQIQAAIDTLPDYFIFFTGCNNVSTYINDPTEYYRQFVSRIEWVKRALPDTEIYVICMLPASDRFIQYENYHVARSPEYDAQLKLVCQDTGVHYVDCHWMVRQELYLEDGLHFNLAFYTVLIKFLAIEMGL